MAAALASAGPALAAGLVAPEGEAAREQRLRVYVSHEGDTETLVEEVELDTDAERFGWLRVFPSIPTEVRPVDPGFFDALDHATKVERPFREVLDDSLFGPSIVTLVGSRFHKATTTRAGAEDLAPPKRFRVELAGISWFKLDTATATLSWGGSLPEPLEAWLTTNGFKLGRLDRLVVVRYLSRGWVLGAAILEGPRVGRARLGPTLYRFASPEPIHPVMMHVIRDSERVNFEYYALGKAPLVGAEFDTLWLRRPWEGHPTEPASFVATYSQPVDITLSLDLETLLGKRPAPASHLTRSTFRFKDAPTRDITFTPAKNPEPLPGTDRRGSLLDVLLCMLLGLTPLLYTPESWFLIWISARARDRRGRNAPPGLALWPFYAVAVALFWFFALEGAGRAAAVLPMLIGIRQLATPARRDPRPVRATFKKEKKAQG